MITLDFETKAIEDFKPLLPEPVGCAIRLETGISHYYSWGHPTENNCTKEEFRNVLLQHWDGEILTQNGLPSDRAVTGRAGARVDVTGAWIPPDQVHILSQITD